MSGDYYGQFNPVLLAMLPANLESVLEFGCASGALARRYRDGNACQWIGIEAFPDAAAAARSAMTACHAIDGEDTTTVAQTLGDQTFSALIYADCLEHFRDPHGSLAAHLRYLADGGSVFISLPNAQHWTMLRELMEGRFNYQSEGLFDYTHLHFFTLNSTDAMFSALGMKRVAARPIIPIPTAPLLEGSKRRLPVLRAAEAYFGRPLTALEIARFDAYQMVVEYRRRP